MSKEPVGTTPAPSGLGHAWIEGGSVATPAGFRAGGIGMGIKNYGAEPRMDVGLLACEGPCTAVALFTRNQICGAPVTVSREHLADGTAQAIAVNSGCSNVGRGAAGVADARRMAAVAADRLQVPASAVLVASTGVIARPLPLEKVEAGLTQVELSKRGGASFSRAILTTDKVPKSRALNVGAAGHRYTLGGCAKGSGMANPDMATVLVFLTTDAPIDRRWAQETLQEVADETLNRLNIDLDTSTSDSLFLMSSGLAGGSPLDAQHPAAGAFRDGLEALCKQFTIDLAQDGEGARTLVVVRVSGARSRAEARAAADTVVSSPLVKTMITGRDPNAGRVLMALGRSSARVEEQRVTLSINGVSIYQDGGLAEADPAHLKAALEAPTAEIHADLGLGSAEATAWGCDLTEDYIRINADYTT